MMETVAAWGGCAGLYTAIASLLHGRGEICGAGAGCKRDLRVGRFYREEHPGRTGPGVREAQTVTAMKCIHIAILLLCLAASLLAAGCVSEGDDDVAVVEYNRTGGIAGFDDRLVIYENGTATVSRDGTVTTFSPDPQALARVRAIVASEAFQSLEESYLPQQQGYDLISYEVTAGGKGVRAEDGAVPAALEPLITELNEIIRESTAP